MKTRLLSLIVLLFILTGGLAAQKRQQSTPEDRATKQTEALTEKLSLSAEQKKKVYDINLKYAKQAAPQKSDSQNREDIREEFKKQQDQKDAELKAVLTADQQKKYTEYQKEKQQKRRK